MALPQSTSWETVSCQDPASRVGWFSNQWYQSCSVDLSYFIGCFQYVCIPQSTKTSKIKGLVAVLLVLFCIAMVPMSHTLHARLCMMSPRTAVDSWPISLHSPPNDQPRDDFTLGRLSQVVLSSDHHRCFLICQPVILLMNLLTSCLCKQEAKDMCWHVMTCHDGTWKQDVLPKVETKNSYSMSWLQWSVMVQCPKTFNIR